MSFDARLFLYACPILDTCVSFKISHHNMYSAVKKKKKGKGKKKDKARSMDVKMH